MTSADSPRMPPEEARALLLKELTILYVSAGKPAVRPLAEAAVATGLGGISHSTVNNILKTPHKHSKDHLAMVVSALGGDVQRMVKMWEDANMDMPAGRRRRAGTVPPALTTEPVQQTLSVTDELFLISHDRRSGRCVAASRRLAYGLAAAVLGELIQAGNVEIRDHRVVIAHPHPSADIGPVPRYVLEQLCGEDQELTVRDCIQGLSSGVCRWVAQHLAEAKLIINQMPGFWGRRSPRYPRTPQGLSIDPGVRIAGYLLRGAVPDPRTQLLTGLIKTMEMEHRVIPIHPPVDNLRTRLHTATSTLPPPLVTLLNSLNAAIAARITGHGSMWIGRLPRT